MFKQWYKLISVFFRVKRKMIVISLMHFCSLARISFLRNWYDFITVCSLDNVYNTRFICKYVVGPCLQWQILMISLNWLINSIKHLFWALHWVACTAFLCVDTSVNVNFKLHLFQIIFVQCRHCNFIRHNIILL